MNSLREQELGRIDLISSWILLFGSLLLFSIGSTEITSHLSQPQWILPLVEGRSSIPLTENGEEPISLIVKTTPTLSMHGYGDTDLSDETVQIEFNASTNMLGQLKEGTLRLSTEEEAILLKLTGIFPLRLSTHLLSQDEKKNHHLIFQEHLRLSSVPQGIKLSSNSFLSFAHKVYTHLRERGLLKKEQKESSTPHPPPLTFKELQKELTMLLESEEKVQSEEVQ